MVGFKVVKDPMDEAMLMKDLVNSLLLVYKKYYVKKED